MRNGLKYSLMVVFLASAIVGHTSGTAEADGEQQVQIRFENHGAARHEDFLAMTEHFNGLHPAVQVEFYTNTGEWQPQLMTQVAAGTAPDITTHIGRASMAPWVEAGHLADLTDEKFIVDHVKPEALPHVSHNGRVYAVPVTTEVAGVLYNREHFRQAGIADAPETYAQLEEVVRKLKDAGITPFAVTGQTQFWTGGFQMFYLGSYALESEFVGDHQIGSLNDGSWSWDRPAFREWLDSFNLMMRNTQSRPMDVDYGGHFPIFAVGETAMLAIGNWAFAQIRELSPDINVGMFPLPIGEDPTAPKFPSGYSLVLNVMSQTEEMDAVRTFLTWFSDVEGPNRAWFERLSAPTGIVGTEKIELDAMNADYLDDLNSGNTAPFLNQLLPVGYSTDIGTVLQSYVADYHAGREWSYATLVEQLNEVNKVYQGKF